MNTLPAPRNLVLIGGGHSHALILKHWGLSPLPDVRVTVINPGAAAAYSGMLPGFVAGHYPREALELDILRLAEFAGGCAVMGRATAIDRENRLVHIEGQPPVPYDIASVDIGITSAMPDLTGFADHGIPAKPLEAFATRWDTFRRKVHAGEIAPEVAIIGGGVAGAELALAMAYALRSVSNTQVSLIDHSDILSEMRPATRRAVLKALAKAGVQLRPQSRVAEVRADEVVFADGSTLAAQFTLGAAGARPYGWLTQTGLELQGGFIKVGPTLQSSDPRIFACGDCAHLTHAPRPKAGVFAVREAPVLFDNLQAALRDESEARLRPYHPQKDYLKLVSLGRKSALADKSGLRVSGPLIWRWKDHIDRTFMKQVKDLPQAPDKND